MKTVLLINGGTMNPIEGLKNHELLEKFGFLVKEEKEVTSQVIAHLAEIDRRKLYLEEGYSSLFSYCVEKYHYSEESTYRRIQAARLSLKFPEVLRLLEMGKMNLTTLTLISPHLTQENKSHVLSQVEGKTKREVEYFLVSLFPKEEPQDKIRKLAVMKEKATILPAFASEGLLMKKEAKNSEISKVSLQSEWSRTEWSATERSTAEIETTKTFVLPMRLQNFTLPPQTKKIEKISPVRPQRFKIEFSASEGLTKKIQRAKEILRHQYPEGRLEDIFEEAIELLLEKKDPERKIERMQAKDLKKGNKEHPESENSIATSGKILRHSNRISSKAAYISEDIKRALQKRYIPQHIRQEVYQRDQGQCSYVGSEGRKCGEKNFLEMDHIEAWALGGASTTQNVRLLCRAHNQWRANITFRLSAH